MPQRTFMSRDVLVMTAQAGEGFAMTLLIYVKIWLFVGLLNWVAKTILTSVLYLAWNGYIPGRSIMEYLAKLNDKNV